MLRIIQGWWSRLRSLLILISTGWVISRSYERSPPLQFAYSQTCRFSLNTEVHLRIIGEGPARDLFKIKQEPSICQHLAGSISKKPSPIASSPHRSGGGAQASPRRWNCGDRSGEAEPVFLLAPLPDREAIMTSRNLSTPDMTLNCHASLSMQLKAVA